MSKGFKVKILYDGIGELLRSSEIGEECQRVAREQYGNVPHTKVYVPHDTGQRMAVKVFQAQTSEDMESNNLLKGASDDRENDN